MKVNVVLNFASTSNAKLAVVTANYTQCVSSDKIFPEGDFKTLVSHVNTSNAAFQAAMTAPISESKTYDVRVARQELERCVGILANAVEVMANQPGLTDDERLAIVHSAGMQVKSKSGKKKRVFNVTPGNTEGTAYAVAAGGANAHEWQYTSDLVTYGSRVSLDSTTVASKQISGLKSGTKYAFFHRPVVVGALMEWEGPFLFTAQK